MWTHLRCTGLTYGQHARRAHGMAQQLARAAVAMWIHALCPWWHVDTGSTLVRRVHASLETPPPKDAPTATAHPRGLRW